MGEAQRLPEQLVDGVRDALLENTIAVVDGTLRCVLQLTFQVLQAKRKRFLESVWEAAIDRQLADNKLTAATILCPRVCVCVYLQLLHSPVLPQ